ncbi:MAG: hypothetical protein CML06_12945 [Pseudomonadales bacterium]|nr:hypothetical protein [Pseudomonadales bacterium]
MMGLNKFGLIEVTLASENLLLWGAVADMVLLCIALGDKFHEERNLKLRAQSLAIRAVAREKHAKEQAIASERTAQAALEETAHAQWRYQQLLERRVSDRTLELTRLRQELQHASEHDGLTQLKNRRHFMTQLASAVARSAAGAETFALLMVDIDHFKTINDTYGHLAGDECIRGVARLMQEQLQWAAVSLCRYGGEEFVALVPVRNEAQAQSIADELRARVANCPIACGQDRVLLTISIGVVMVPAATPKPVDRLLQQVDAALYQAKDQGRNCVALATG